MNAVNPAFAVIGRVNKGKSSIVSTLTEDDSVLIESGAGTTVHCREFPVRVDGQTLLTLIDTPGFQQAPRALAWMQAHEVSAANRREVIKNFLKKFDGTDDFVDECRLLKPIMAGAGVLYVVDGAKPFRRNYEAEMEILRWTGQPRMALINQIGAGDYTSDWQPALDQYFSIVRKFNAHFVGFRDRIRLLESFRELHEPWRPNLEAAIKFLKGDWERRERAAIYTIAKMICEQLTFVRELVIERYERAEDYRLKLEREFHDALRDNEKKARRNIEKLYQHHKIEVQDSELAKPIFDEDLFAETTWSMLGLTYKQLVGIGAFAGATVGGAMDATLGGSSFFMGTLVGGALGAGSVMFYSNQRLASIETLKKFVKGSQILKIGPHQNKNFPWVLLDRALLHYISIRNLAHSRRMRINLSDENKKAGITSRLGNDQRKVLTKIFNNIRKKDPGEPTRQPKDLELELRLLIKKCAD